MSKKLNPLYFLLFLSFPLVLSLFIISGIAPASQVNAQIFPNAPQSGNDAPPKFYFPQSRSQSQGDGDYSQYYHFGKISVEADPAQSKYQAGNEAEFKGVVANANEYAIFDGEIYAQIFQENQKGQSQNGDYITDQFFLPGKFNLKAGEKLPLSFTYNIPASAQAGNYKVAFFFVIDQKYNMAGLSFLNNSYAGFTNVEIVNTTDKQTLILIDRNNIKFNDKPIIQRAVMPQVKESEKVAYDIPIENQSNIKKTVTVKETLYFWDGLNEKNKITQKEENLTIDPGATFIYQYLQDSFQEPVYFLVIEAKEQGQDAKSIINLRFGANVNPRARINYSGLTKFPLAKGETAIFFTNFHSTANTFAPNSRVEVILKDKKGKTLDKLDFTGDIQGNIQLKKKEFAAKSNLDYAAITSTIKNQDGQVVDEGEIILDAAKLTGYQKPAAGIKILPDFLSQKPLGIKIAILAGLAVILAAVIGAAIKIQKKRPGNKFPGGPAIFLLLAAAAIFSAGLFQSPPAALSGWAESGGSASLTIGPWKIWGFDGQSYLETSKCDLGKKDPATGLYSNVDYEYSIDEYGSSIRIGRVKNCYARLSSYFQDQRDFEQCIFVLSGAEEEILYPPSFGISGSGTCANFDFNSPSLVPWTNEMSLDVSYNVQLTSGNNVFSSGSTNNYTLGAEPINMSFTKDGEWRGTGFGIDSPPAVWMGKYCDGCLDNYKFRDTDIIACTLNGLNPSWMNEPNQNRYYVGTYDNSKVTGYTEARSDAIYAPLEVEGQNVSILGSGSISCSYDTVYNQYKCQANSGGPGSVTVKVAETKFRQGLYGINNRWGLFHYCTTARDYEKMILNADARGKTTIYQNDSVAKKYLTIPAYTKTYQFNVIGPPPPVTDLTATQQTACPGGITGVKLTWSIDPAKTDEVYVYREQLDSQGKVITGTWKQLAYIKVSGSAQMLYTDAGVDFNKNTWQYHVTPYKRVSSDSVLGGVKSNYATSQAKEVCPPVAPTNLRVVNVLSCSKVDLQWVDNSDNETGFKMERATNQNGPWTSLGTLSANVTTYADSGLTEKTTYYYRVKALGSIGDSAYSSTQITMPSCSGDLNLSGEVMDYGSGKLSAFLRWNISGNRGKTLSSTFDVFRIDKWVWDPHPETQCAYWWWSGWPWYRWYCLWNKTVTVDWKQFNPPPGSFSENNINVRTGYEMYWKYSDSNVQQGKKYKYQIADFSYKNKNSPSGSATSYLSNEAIIEIPFAPNLTFSAKPTTVDWGGSSTLEWKSTDTTYCKARGDWSETKSVTGSQTISPLTFSSSADQTKKYILACFGPGGGIEKTVTVSVGALPAPAACVLPWGGTIASGQSVTAYQSSAGTCASPCQSQVRACDNGQLSGSFTYQTCVDNCINLPCTDKKLNAVTSLVNPTQVLNGKTFTIQCDYGLKDVTFIEAKSDAVIGGKCVFANQWNGTAAVFTCTAGVVGENLKNYCEIAANNQNYCVGVATEIGGIKVVNNFPPKVTSPSLSPPSEAGFCASPPVYTFSWKFDSNGDNDKYAASKLEICKSPRSGCSTFSFGTLVTVQFTLGSFENLVGRQLTYNTGYEWRVQVKDDYDANSAWSDWSELQTFTTPSHQYPAAVDFSVTPSSPPENTSVVFDAGASQCFGSSGSCQYSWIFPSGDPASATGQNPTTKFTSRGNKTVTLNVKDENNYSCPFEKEVNVRWGLPDWKEILPW